MIRDNIEKDWLDRNIFIHPTAKIYPGVVIENGVEIGPYAVIGKRAQIKNGYDNLPVGKVTIKTGAKIGPHCQIDSGSFRHTVIGENAFVMGNVHVGHDCEIGKEVVLSQGAILSGEVRIGDYTNIGIGAVIHQQIAIPAKCMLGMGAVLTKKAALQMRHAETWAGNPAKKLGPNKKWI